MVDKVAEKSKLLALAKSAVVRSFVKGRIFPVSSILALLSSFINLPNFSSAVSTNCPSSTVSAYSSDLRIANIILLAASSFILPSNKPPASFRFPYQDLSVLKTEGAA